MLQRLTRRRHAGALTLRDCIHTYIADVPQQRFAILLRNEIARHSFPFRAQTMMKIAVLALVLASANAIKPLPAKRALAVRGGAVPEALALKITALSTAVYACEIAAPQYAENKYSADKGTVSDSQKFWMRWFSESLFQQSILIVAAIKSGNMKSALIANGINFGITATRMVATKKNFDPLQRKLNIGVMIALTGLNLNAAGIF